METTNKKVHPAAAFVLGGLVGAGLALLFAPQSGRRTRQDIRYLGKVIKNKSEEVQIELQHGIQSLVADVSEKFQAAIEQGREWTDETVPALLNALEAGKRRIKEEVEKIVHARV
jgi:gas vesicle protein